MSSSNGLKIMGGKSFIVDWIIENLDYSKLCYVELFGGTGIVLCNKPHHKVEVYNDINNELVNLFLVLINNFDEFEKRFNELLYSERLFYMIKDGELKPKDDIDRALFYFYLMKTSFSCNFSSFSYSFSISRSKIFFNSINHLKNIKERFKNVQILNKDFRDILESIKDKEDIILYADPPYFNKEFYYRNFKNKEIKFGKEEHKILAEYLNKAKYSVALSYYYFDGIEELYPKDKWIYLKKETTKYSYGITKNLKTANKPKAEELLILNYEPKRSLYNCIIK